MHPDKFLGRRGHTIRPMMSEDDRSDRLAALGSWVSERRKDAVDARKASGIEDTWMMCEESYLGIDDMNRGEFAKAKWAKPTSMKGPLTSNKVNDDRTRSSAFVGLTRRYVDSAAAKVCEIMLPIDDKAFSFKPTPDPTLVKQLNDESPAVDANGAGMTKPVAPAQPAVPAAPTVEPAAAAGQPPAAPAAAPAVAPVTNADVAKATMDLAVERAARAETRIYDWMVEGKYAEESRKVAADSARIGVGVLKGPYPKEQISRAITKGPNGKGVAIQMETKIIPGQCWVDPWNCFPDDACGENIHDGEYFLERDFLSKKMLKKLCGQEGYLKHQIELVLKEGPGKEYESGGNPNEKDKDRKRFEIWYFYGMVRRDDMLIADADGIDDLPHDKEEVPAILSLVNDHVIRAVINPAEDGAFPYDVFSWSRRPGQWAGVGVAEQGAMPQRVANASIRSLLNNAGLSGGVQIVMDRQAINPANGQWTITPNKIWNLEAGAEAAKAFLVATIPNVGPQMMAILELAERQFEQATGIPLVTQGQKGPTTPQTFGQAELQDNNSLTWLRSVATRYDEQITEPKVNKLYDWLLLDPDVPDDEKGDFQCDAHGSSAMVERAIQEIFLMNLLQASANPAFNLDPGKLMTEMLKAKRMDPRQVQLTEEQIKERAAQPPVPPIELQVEQARGQNALQLQQAKAQAEMQAQEGEQQPDGSPSPQMMAAQAKIESEKIRAASAENRENSRADAEAARAQSQLLIAQQNGELRIKELELEREIAILKYTSEQKISLADAQVQLAQRAITERTKRELGAAEIELAVSEGDKDRGVQMNTHPKSLVRDEMTTGVTP